MGAASLGEIRRERASVIHFVICDCTKMLDWSGVALQS